MRPPAAPRRPAQRGDTDAPPDEPRATPESEEAAAGFDADEPEPEPTARRSEAFDDGGAAVVSAPPARFVPVSRRSAVEHADGAAEPLLGAPRVSQIGDRLAEREHARRRRARVRLGISAGVIAVLAALGWVVLASPVLALRADAVEVAGAGGFVDAAAVAAAADAQVGVPLARLDVEAVADAVEALPAVADADVSRAWPSGLRIDVTQRIPVALVPVDAGTMLLDAEGVVIATVPPDGEVPPGLPELTVPLGDEARATSVSAVLEVLGALPADLRSQVTSAGARSEQSVRLELADGARVEWGSAAESDLKAAVLATLLQVGAAYYDVSAPEAPITR